MIIAFIIWSVIAAIFVGIGISCLNADKAVGFFTIGKTPIMKDNKRYNKAVARLWIVFAVIFEVIGIPLFSLEQNSPRVILLVFAVLIWVIALIVSYLKIESKHRK